MQGPSSQFPINLKWELSWNLLLVIVISGDGLIKSRYLFSLNSCFLEQLSFSVSVFILFGKYFKNNCFCFSSFLLKCFSFGSFSSILLLVSSFGSSFSFSSSLVSLLILFSFVEDSFLFYFDFFFFFFFVVSSS